LEISKGKQTTNCSRTKGAKARNHKRKKSEADGGVKISMFPIFDLLLKN
jgi:hypothetical protein